MQLGRQHLSVDARFMGQVDVCDECPAPDNEPEAEACGED